MKCAIVLVLYLHCLLFGGVLAPWVQTHFSIMPLLGKRLSCNKACTCTAHRQHTCRYARVPILLTCTTDYSSTFRISTISTHGIGLCHATNPRGDLVQIVASQLEDPTGGHAANIMASGLILSLLKSILSSVSLSSGQLQTVPR
jgi:hypothetical protein